jgi:DNA-binding CsgD family transcriptional regulator
LLLVDEEGAVVDAPESAIRWLRAFRLGDNLDRVGMLLASLTAHLRRIRDNGGEQQSLRVRMRSSGGAWTTLIAEPLRSGADEQKIPIVVMATDSVQLFPLQVAAFGLTEREAGVVLRVLEGLDTKGIAARLSISVLTVQDHLKSIFDKTGVHSRRELAYLVSGAPVRFT